jgi:kynurenine formamidase
MTIIDLSHTLQNGMPVFPGDAPPEFQKSMTHENDGAQVIRMDIATHHGTHLDCPLHFVAGGESTESSGIEHFFGNAYLADCSGFKAGEIMPASHFESLDVYWNNIKWIVIYTGWYKHWGNKKYFDHFPVLSKNAAEFLVEKGIQGIGLDVISIDAIDSVEYPVHKITLGNGLFIIENLTNLNSIPQQYFRLAAFPLKIQDGDGSPVRAVAVLD